MRKVITIYLAACCIGSHSCRQHDSGEANGKADQALLIQELDKLSEESGLSWNIPYRKALIESRRPMGYIFEYSVNFLHYEKDISKSQIRIHVGVIFPESIVTSKKINLYLDNKIIGLSELETLRKNKNTGVSEVDLYFEVPLKLFLESNGVYIKIDGEKDLLVSDKMSFDKRLKNWHQKGEKTGKLPDGVLAFPVRF